MLTRHLSSMSAANWIVLFLFIGCSYTKSPRNKSISRPIFTSHPMLYYGTDRLEYLRKSAWTTHKNITILLKECRDRIMENQKYYLPPKTYEKFGAKWNELYGNNLPPLALYYVLNPNDNELKKLLFLYMDRMADLHKWQVISSPGDEVPLAHSLAGFATAVDMMYKYLDGERTKKYMSKIINVTSEMYELSKKRWWGRTYLQNHVATNVVALFIGSVVAELHLPEATTWKLHSIEMFERTMQLLKHISDGSLNEGVGYVGYTFRSISEYIFLVKRHCNIDHTKHPWLMEHFAFNYHTVLPGFKHTIGIGDASIGWFYGPESQLTFLESFVLKNGSAIWLANRMREVRGTFVSSHYYTTIRTEYLWFDPSIKPVPPKSYGRSELHHFDDWGVVTYKTAHQVQELGTFCSFKSSYVHGKAIFNIANGLVTDNTKFVTGWNFNPGHEHPDQNSFTFVPHGHVFIGEGYYSTKLSYLNNILMFGPSLTDTCSPPFVGQLGDCHKWFKWQSKEQSTSHGTIKFHGLQDGIMYVSGEAVKAYPSSLKLKSVSRTLIMLDEDILIVVDHVEKLLNSKVTHVSAHFNNVFHNFTHVKYSNGINGAQIKPLPDVELNCLWLSASGDNPKGQIHYIDYQQERTPNKASNLNITFAFSGLNETFVYLFIGPISKTKHFSISNAHFNGTVINVETENNKYILLRTMKENVHNFAVKNMKTGIFSQFPQMGSVDVIVKHIKGIMYSEHIDSILKPTVNIIFSLGLFLLLFIVKKSKLRSKRLRKFVFLYGCGLCIFIIFSTYDLPWTSWY